MEKLYKVLDIANASSYINPPQITAIIIPSRFSSLKDADKCMVFLGALNITISHDEANNLVAYLNGLADPIYTKKELQ